jgi:SAM-dependent methyltransferase
MSFFSKFPEFVELDSRKDRGFSQVTIDTLDKRHAAMAPEWLVNGKTVLDLGSCLGATGQWCLGHNASHYTGVEVQPELAQTSKTLLSKYWDSSKFEIVQEDLREFLDSQIQNNKKYDVIIMIGIIYAFLDTYGILDRVSKLSDNVIVIDSGYPWPMNSPNDSIISVVSNQQINSPNANTAFSGAGARPSPAAMRIMFDSLGFTDNEGLIYPEELNDTTVHSSYTSLIEREGQTIQLPARYLMRYFKSSNKNVLQVADLVKNNVESAKVTMTAKPTIIDPKGWKFDSNVADRFQKEAETHIPDYARVIDMCLDYAKLVYPNNKDISIIDVGSALGNTIDKFLKAGYTNVTGVDNSDAMRVKSLHPELVTISERLPKGPYNCILSNWTLHFIPTQERKQYIQDMHDQLVNGGFVIISDKMKHSQETEELYYDFKRSNGETEDVIQAKKKSLVGVLTPESLSWYLETLENSGFTDIQVINSRYMFSTIYARKP